MKKRADQGRSQLDGGEGRLDAGAKRFVSAPWGLADPRHDPPMAPAADRPQVDVRAKETGSPRDQEGPLRPDRPDGYGESGVGLHAHPGGAEEPGPWGGPEYGRQGAQGPRDPARAR